MAISDSQATPAADPVVIKKYANRRLYNTAKSSYVTLDDLSRMVRSGEEFQVFDAKTGEDITRSVLTQIIFDQEAKGQKMLPTNFLRQLIRLYGDAMQGIVPGYLDASMDAFARNQERIRASMGTGNAFKTFEAMARSNMEWFEQAMRMFQGFGGARSPEEAKEAQAREPRPLATDLEEVQRQLAEMRAQLERMSAFGAGAPGAAPDARPTERAEGPADEAAERPADDAAPVRPVEPTGTGQH